jgi:hypothetical protein
METARTPASHRPRNGREEVVVPLGVAMGSPTTFADDDPAGEGGRTGVSATKVGSAGVLGEASRLCMASIPDPTPETVLRKIEGIRAGPPILGEQSPREMSDRAAGLVERAARGDQEAFEALRRARATPRAASATSCA